MAEELVGNIEGPAIIENGDLYDDEGNYQFTLTLPNDALPAYIEIFHNGYWYKFAIDGRSKATELEEHSNTVSSEIELEPEPVKLDKNDPLGNL